MSAITTAFERSGTRLAWIIDPIARTAAIYHAPGEPTRVVDMSGSLDGEQVLPDRLQVNFNPG